MVLYREMMLDAYEQYHKGAKAATGNSMCSLTENAAYCFGWDNNNTAYGDWDCGDVYDNYTGPFSSVLLGCHLTP